MRIVNVIASTKLYGSIDVEKINYIIKNTEYNPEIFPGLILRRLKPKSTLILFSSGKITSVGSDSENKAINSIKITIQEINKIKCIIGNNRFDSINIENVVAVYDLKKELNLKVIRENLQNVLLEPTKFPALLYRPKKGSEVILIFSSGKLVLTGANSEVNATELLKNTIKIINNLHE